MTHTLLEDIGLALIAATVLGLLAERLRQPVILGYLVAGAVIGPEIGFKLVSDLQNIHTISEIGLILLLFVVGLELNPQQVVQSGKHVLITGVGQYVICVGLGLGFFLLMGYNLTRQDMGALYLALLCAMSSTAIVAKLLFDKLELETIHGRITLGVLVIQDLWAIVILAFQPNLANPKISLMGLAVFKAAVLAFVAFIVSKYVLSRIYNWVSKLPEMIVAVSLGWCAVVAGAGGMLGLSKEMGALIAGVAISSFPYSVHVTEKTLPLRDFFLTLFFVSIGMKMIAPKPEMMFATAAIVAFVIASRLLSVYPILSLLGAGRRT
jgi:Kef-type K+ transport system membrane component KefB